MCGDSVNVFPSPIFCGRDFFDRCLPNLLRRGGSQDLLRRSAPHHRGIVPKHKKRRFSTFNSQILAFKAWLLENDCRDVCMESTGKYWIPVFNLLEDSINVTIANPKWVKTVKGNKDDA